MPAPPARALHESWLLELTQIPTAAGREGRVIDWITRWAAERDDLVLTTGPAGNLHLAFRDPPSSTEPPVYFTAHLDHPAFVVERIVSPTVVQLQFRGGVMEDYFRDARVAVHAGVAGHPPLPAQLLDIPKLGAGAVFGSCTAELGADRTDAVRVGDVATWDLPPAEMKDNMVHTAACDDLAAAAAALAAFDTLRVARRSQPCLDVRLLFTRAEEVGFIGAIAACKHRTMRPGSRVIALENSRSFDDSPIGGGPIVRVGDRLSIFDPLLTDAIAKRAEELSGAPAVPSASQKTAERTATGGWPWQRKLMAGGACEATVFCAAGYQATCLCLPLGNYHNMADLTAVQAGKNTAPPAIAREFISLTDYHGLIDLLVACGQRLTVGRSMQERLDKLWAERSFVLSEPPPNRGA
jgi:putative aminopeptidase FrvX